MSPYYFSNKELASTSATSEDAFTDIEKRTFLEYP